MLGLNFTIRPAHPLFFSPVSLGCSGQLHLRLRPQSPATLLTTFVLDLFYILRPSLLKSSEFPETPFNFILKDFHLCYPLCNSASILVTSSGLKDHLWIPLDPDDRTTLLCNYSLQYSFLTTLKVYLSVFPQRPSVPLTLRYVFF